MFVDLIDSLLAREAPGERPVLHLLGEPFVTVGSERVELSEGGKRVLAFAALHVGRLDRRYVACTLWPDGSEMRAAGNLRSALWRLKGAGACLISANRSSLALGADVLVDAHLLGRWAARLIGGTPDPADLAHIPRGLDRLELLHGCYDDWVLTERECLRQRILHALEEASRRLMTAGRHAEAVEAAIVAVGAEPLRESAHRTLIEAYLAEGNVCEGRRGYEAYQAMLLRELGVRPEPGISALLASGHAYSRR